VVSEEVSPDLQAGRASAIAVVRMESRRMRSVFFFMGVFLSESAQSRCFFHDAIIP
jgi:hypothetical protein